MELSRPTTNTIPTMNTTFESTNTTTFLNTSLESENTTNSEDFEIDDFRTLTIVILILILFMVASLISLFTLLFGVITWILIPKWRSFKNYVYVNVIFCYTMSSWLFYGLVYVDDDIGVSLVIFYFVNASSCWLLIASIIIYMDIVIVFNSNITRKVLKCNVFCWGVPLLLSALHILGELTSLKILVYLLKERFLFVGLLLVINFCLYVRALYSLLKNTAVNGSPRFWQKFQVATFTFVLSGAPVLIATIISLPLNNTFSFGFMLRAALPSLQTVIMSVSFLLLKTNRVSWRKRRVTVRSN